MNKTAVNTGSGDGMQEIVIRCDGYLWLKFNKRGWEVMHQGYTVGFRDASGVLAMMLDIGAVPDGSICLWKEILEKVQSVPLKEVNT